MEMRRDHPPARLMDDDAAEEVMEGWRCGEITHQRG